MKSFIEYVTERNDAPDLYFGSMSAALQSVEKALEKKKLGFDDEERWNKIAVGPSKPGKGKTNKYSIKLTGSKTKKDKYVHIQIFNRGTPTNPFELNWYYDK